MINLSIQNFTSGTFFENLFHIISVKIHLHHSCVTSKIYGYVHDFSNHKVCENRNFISFIAHNLFDFDIHFVLKGIRLSVSKTKDLNIGSSNLNNASFFDLSNQLKNFNTLKYYEKHLAQIAATITPEEILAVKMVTRQFICQHDYLNKV